MTQEEYDDYIGKTYGHYRVNPLKPGEKPSIPVIYNPGTPEPPQKNEK